MPITDEHLLELVSRGDRGAFWELYDRLAPRVLGLIVSILRDRAESEDVLQDVMLEVWARAGRYDPNLGMAAQWVLRIARSRAIDTLRKRRRRERLPDHSVSNTADLSPLAAETVPALARAMNELPNDLRTVLHLAYMQGLSRDQIAVHLGIPVGTVKTRVRSGTAKLAAMLSVEERPV